MGRLRHMTKPLSVNGNGFHYPKDELQRTKDCERRRKEWRRRRSECSFPVRCETREEEKKPTSGNSWVCSCMNSNTNLLRRADFQDKYHLQGAGFGMVVPGLQILSDLLRIGQFAGVQGQGDCDRWTLRSVVIRFCLLAVSALLFGSRNK